MPKRNVQFDQISVKYDTSLPIHVIEHYTNKRFQFLKSLWHNDMARALDVGAGTGMLTTRLQAAGWKVTGIDQSRAMLRLMVERDCIAVQADSVNLPFPDDTFDVVYCVAMLHHIAEPAAVRSTIRQMVRVTRPGGFAVFWDHNPFNPYWPIIMARLPQDTGEERLIPEKEIVEAMNGLSVDVYSRQMGFVADIVPLELLKLFQTLERIIEAVPGVRRFLCAHNVVVARKSWR